MALALEVMRFRRRGGGVIMIRRNTIIPSPLRGKTFITAAYTIYSRYLMSIQMSVHFHLTTCTMKLQNRPCLKCVV